MSQTPDETELLEEMEEMEACKVAQVLLDGEKQSKYLTLL